MEKIKINANPYTKKNEYLVFDKRMNNYIVINEEKHPLLKKKFIESNMSIIAEDLLLTIEKTYYINGGEKVLVEFKGTDLEFECLEKSVKENHSDKIELMKNDKVVQDVKKTAEEFRKMLKEITKELSNFNSDTLKDDIDCFVKKIETLSEEIVNSDKDSIIIDNYKVKCSDLLLKLMENIKSKMTDVDEEIIESEKTINSIIAKIENLQKSLNDMFEKFTKDLETKITKISKIKTKIVEISKIDENIKNRYKYAEWKKFEKIKDKEIINKIKEKIELINKDVIDEVDKKFEEHKLIIRNEINDVYLNIVNPYKEKFKCIICSFVTNDNSVKILTDSFEKSLVVDYQDILSKYEKCFEKIDKFCHLFSKYKHVDPKLVLAKYNDTSIKLYNDIVERIIKLSKKQVSEMLANLVSNVNKNIDDYNNDIVLEKESKSCKEKLKMMLINLYNNMNDYKNKLEILMVFD